MKKTYVLQNKDVLKTKGPKINVKHVDVVNATATIYEYLEENEFPDEVKMNLQRLKHSMQVHYNNRKRKVIFCTEK